MDMYWAENRGADGERGIRTLDTVSRIHAFQACAFSHSAISPIINSLLQLSPVGDNTLMDFASREKQHVENVSSKTLGAFQACAFRHSATSPLKRSEKYFDFSDFYGALRLNRN